MKVYVLVECQEIEVWEEPICECCGPEECTYSNYSDVIGVYSTLKILKNKLKQLGLNKEEIDFMLDNKWNSYKGYCYYLKEMELF